MPKKKANSAAAAQRVANAKSKITELVNKGYKINPKVASAFTASAMGVLQEPSGRQGPRGGGIRAGQMAENDALFNPGPRRNKPNK